MEADRVERKLSAILAAGVARYSRLIGAVYGYVVMVVLLAQVVVAAIMFALTPRALP